MFKVVPLEGFNYSKTTYEEIIGKIKEIPEYTQCYLGDSYDGHEMFGFSLGDMSKPTIYIQGNIHGGHEWRTVHWVGKFMEVLQNPKGLPQEKIINSLKARYSFYFIPSCNPDGYVNNTYGNGNGVSLSENFDFMWDKGEKNPESPYYQGEYPFSEPEAQHIRDVILDVKPVSVVCNHTWGGHTGFCIRRPQNGYFYELLHDMYKSVYITTGESSDRDSRFHSVLNKASVYNWAGELKSRVGRDTLALVFETGSLRSHYDQAMLGLNGMLIYCMYVDKWMTENVLKFDTP